MGNQSDLVLGKFGSKDIDSAWNSSDASQQNAFLARLNGRISSTSQNIAATKEATRQYSFTGVTAEPSDSYLIFVDGVRIDQVNLSWAANIVTLNDLGVADNADVRLYIGKPELS